jgi:hypothetical protein
MYFGAINGANELVSQRLPITSLGGRFRNGFARWKICSSLLTVRLRCSHSFALKLFTLEYISHNNLLFRAVSF